MKHTIAICYDFDGTLIRGNMQENSFIPEIGMKKADFWQEVKANAKENDMDEVLAYMQMMFEEARKNKIKFNKKSLKEHGKKVELFPGVEDWFDLLDQHPKENMKIQHYIISSGLDEMIRGSKIGGKFQHIFASGFVYDANGAATFPARSINYTTKVQYLFRINKGVLNNWDNSEINQFTPEENRPIPFSRMIYIGDGDTDVPAMKMLNYKGGYSIAVYPPRKGARITKEEKAKKENVEKLKEDNRCQFIAEADYSKGKELHKIVVSLIDRISDECLYNMNLRA